MCGCVGTLPSPMDTTVPADFRLRKRYYSFRLPYIATGARLSPLLPGLSAGDGSPRNCLSAVGGRATEFDTHHRAGCHPFFCDGVSVFAGLRFPQRVSRGAVAPTRMAGHVHHVDAHWATGINCGPVLLVSGTCGARVWGGDCKSLRADVRGGDRGADAGGVDSPCPLSSFWPVMQVRTSPKRHKR
jgi:hypothetical protein